jgi:hypothetical protein
MNKFIPYSTQDISENDIGHVNFKYLQPIFRDNIEIESLNLADCKINGE